jgi:hypothetical protein
MTKAELNAHWALPDETLGDSYTMTHKREREAFVKGWHKAVELFCEWLKENKDHPFIKCEDPCLSGYLTDEFIEDFKKAMEE